MTHLEIEKEIVNVGEFRNRIDHLNRITRTDFHACVNERERSNWVQICKRFQARLISTACKRAQSNDWEMREQAITHVASMLDRANVILCPQLESN